MQREEIYIQHAKTVNLEKENVIHLEYRNIDTMHHSELRIDTTLHLS